ncbi:MAG: response regulator, partial [Planctomycetota bacterium]
RGLGLAIVMKVVARHSGVIFLDTSHNGTSFEVCLPAVNFVGDTENESAKSTSFQPMKIMLVDDDPKVLGATARLLESCGHEVVSFSSGKQALDLLLHGQKFDLLILDVSMPEISGPEIVCELVAHQEPIPTLLISGYNGKMIDNLGQIENSNVVFLNKPFTLFSFQEALKNLSIAGYETPQKKERPGTVTP